MEPEYLEDALNATAGSTTIGYIAVDRGLRREGSTGLWSIKPGYAVNPEYSSWISDTHERPRIYSDECHAKYVAAIDAIVLATTLEHQIALCSREGTVSIDDLADANTALKELRAKIIDMTEEADLLAQREHTWAIGEKHTRVLRNIVQAARQATQGTADNHHEH